MHPIPGLRPAPPAPLDGRALARMPAHSQTSTHASSDVHSACIQVVAVDRHGLGHNCIDRNYIQVMAVADRQGGSVRHVLRRAEAASHRSRLHIAIQPAAGAAQRSCMCDVRACC